MNRYKYSGSLKMYALLALVLGMAAVNTYAQTTGLIYKPATGPGALVLDPNGDGYASQSTSGFLGDDVANSEIPFRPMPVLFSEPSADLRTGSAGGHTDLVDGNSDAPAAYMYANENGLFFRIRIADQSTASKGYSFFIDEYTGPNDSFGDEIINNNPGFKFEVVLQTGGGSAGIAIYDWSDNNGSLHTLLTPLSNYFQKIVAEDSYEGSNSFFYDFYVPWTELTGFNIGTDFTSSTQFRASAATITNAGSGIAGTISDIGGIDDNLYPNPLNGLINVVETFPPTTGNNIEFNDFNDLVASTPSVFGPVYDTDETITGASAEADGASITIYRYDTDGSTLLQTYSNVATVSNNTWTYTNSTLDDDLVAGQFISASATAPGKSPSVESELVKVVGEGGAILQCTVTPQNTTLNGRSGNNARLGGELPGLSTTNSALLTIRGYAADGSLVFAMGDGVYGFDTDAPSSQENPIVPATNLSADPPTFKVNGSPNGFSDVVFVTAQVSGECMSDFGTVGTVTRTAAPVVTSNELTEASTQVSGTHDINGATISVYRNDDATLLGTTTVSGTSWSLSTGIAGQLTDGDFIFARAYVSGQNISERSNLVEVGAAPPETTDIPVITGSYESSDTEVRGYSTEDAGTQIILYEGGSTVLDTVRVDVFGGWTVTGLSLTQGDVLSARALASNELISGFSNEVTVVASIPAAPTVSSPILAGATSISGSGGSGTVSVYADGALLGTSSGSSWTLDISGDADARELIRVGVVITATNTVDGAISPESNEVEVAARPASNINIFAYPASPAAGSVTLITAELTDDFGSTVSGENIDFSLLSGNGTMETPSTGIITNFLGQASLDYTTYTTIETAEVGAVLAANNSIENSVQITNVAGDATQIISVTVDQSAIEVNGSTTVRATVQDAYGNPVPDVTVHFSSDQETRATVAATGTTNASGVATAAVTGSSNESGSVVITASINSTDNNVATSDSETVNLTVAAQVPDLSNSSVSASPTSVQADGSDITTLTMNIRDGSNMAITGLTQGDFAFNNTGNAVAANFIEVGSGVYAVEFTNTTTESVSIQVDVLSIDIGTSEQVSFVGPASAVFTTSEQTVAAGLNSSVITVELRDSEGNTTVAPAGGINFDLSTGGAGEFRNTGDETVITTITIAEGQSQGSFRYYSETAGTDQLSVTDQNTEAGTGSASQNIAIEAGPISVAGGGTLLSGADLSRVADGAEAATITLQLKDAFGNEVSQENVAVVFAATGGDLSATTTATDAAGQASVTLTSTTAGTFAVTAKVDDDGDNTAAADVINGSPVEVEFSAGALAGFRVEADGGGAIGTQTAGAPFSIQITALDANGNTVESFTGTVELSLNQNVFADGGGETAAFTSGVLTGHSVQLNTADAGYRITATNAGVGTESGTSDSFDVSAAAASQLVITTQPTGGTGSEDGTPTGVGTVTLQTRDAFGNPSTVGLNAQQDVTVTLGADPTSGGATLGGTTTKDIQSGTATFEDLTLDRDGAGYTLQFASASPADLGSVESSPFTMSGVEDASGFAVTLAEAGSKAAGEAFDLAITGATGSDGSNLGGAVNVTVTSNQADGQVFNAMASFTAGSATLSNITLEVALDHILTVDVAGVTDDETLPVSVVPGAADAANTTIAASPTEITADGADASTVTVTVRDAFGNLRDAGGDNVFIDTDLGGLSTLTDHNDGTYTAELTSTAAGPATLTGYLGTDASGASVGTTSVDIVAGPATSLTIDSGNNQSKQVTNALDDPLVVKVTDVNGNPVGGVTVNFAVDTVPADATVHALSSATGVTDANGLASVDLTLGEKIGIYTVEASTASPNLGPVTFTATALAGEPAVLSKVSGDGQSEVTETALENAFVVKITDVHGNPVSGESVSFTVSSAPSGAAGHTLTPTNATTNAAGEASSTLTLGNEAGSYEVTVSSGLLANAVFSATAVLSNTAPVLEVNTGSTVDEGTGVIITNAELQVTDAEQGAGDLTYEVVTAPANGSLKMSGTALGLSDTFTQDDIDNSRLSYEHDASETTSDSFRFTVSDGNGGSVGTTSFAMTITPLNDAPVLATNEGLTLVEGASAGITASLLEVTDADQSASDLTYTLEAAPVNGQLKLNGTALSEGQTFTQDDINTNKLTYEHDDSETTSDSFDFSASDGDGGSIAQTTFNVTVTPQNDAPFAGFGRTLEFDGIDDYIHLGGTQIIGADDFRLRLRPGSVRPK